MEQPVLQYDIITTEDTRETLVILYRGQFDLICAETTVQDIPSGIRIGVIDGYIKWIDPEKLRTISSETKFRLTSRLSVSKSEELQQALVTIFDAILKRPQGNAEKKHRVCPECGFLFVPGSKEQVYCSKECSRKARYRRKRHSRAKKGGNGRRYDIYEIYKRDNGICWICGEKCSFDDHTGERGQPGFTPGPKYPTIDHVRPISLGGENSHKNIRLAHWECNGKRDRNYDPVGMEPERQRETRIKDRDPYQWAETAIQEILVKEQKKNR